MRGGREDKLFVQAATGGGGSRNVGAWQRDASNKRPSSSGASRPSSARERPSAAGSAASYARARGRSDVVVADEGKKMDEKKSNGTVDSRVYIIDQKDGREQDDRKVVLSAREPRSSFPVTGGEVDRHQEVLLSARGNLKGTNGPKVMSRYSVLGRVVLLMVARCYTNHDILQKSLAWFFYPLLVSLWHVLSSQGNETR
jgi:hypothetical protein